MSNPLLLQYWKMRRASKGQKTVVKPLHKEIASVLTDLVLGKLNRPNLMILEPPRMGKTDLGVLTFMEWAMSYFPDSEFIHGTWGTDLATNNVKQIRDDLASQWYKDIRSSDWGVQIKAQGNKVQGRQDFFHTSSGGSVKGVGAGTGVIGFGAGKLRKEFGGAIVIDDPLKQQDRNSETIRKTTVDWLDGLEQRRNRKKEPMTPMVLIMQRLHPQDPAGHYLKTQRDRWQVLELQAQQEDGSSIWEERISQSELEWLKEYDPETYWAVYQQGPKSDMYDLINDGWWNYWNDINEVEKRIKLKIITADTAFKEKDSSDFSVLQCWGFESFSGAYLLDQVKGKWQFPDLIIEARDFLKKHTTARRGATPVTEAWVEDKASGTSLVQTLRREGLMFREWLPPNADQKVITSSQILSGPDKVSRVKQASIPIKAGRVYLPYPGMAGFKWVEGFVAEHSAFTADDSHLHDDQVDAETMATLIWMQRGGGVGPLPQWKNKLMWPPSREEKRAA